MTPSELLDAARTLVHRPRPQTAGLWPRAAALLGRQALEEALDDLWSRTAPAIQQASTTCQLLCLPDFLSDRELAGRAAHAWGALTHACHHHPYELSPTAEELDRWLEIVDRLAHQLQKPQPTAAGTPAARGKIDPSSRR